MSGRYLFLKRLRFFSNILFIGIALALFILNIIKYANSYLKRGNYNISQDINGSFYIVKVNYINEIITNANCSSNYSKSDAENIFQWFIASKTSQNQVFHVFYWFMIIIALIISIIPSSVYIGKYLKSDHYHITERYCLMNIILFIRTFFSITIFVFPSYYMYTFNFNSEICLKENPTKFSIQISPFIFATFICLIIFFLFYLIISSFYDKHRFCCSIECLSYCGLCILSLLIIGTIFFSAGIIGWVFIVSFIEEPLRLAVILIIVQFPFLIVQLLAD
ncbi:unnamed protein product [Rotaria sp. Silwood1]|nr:unnamed protein product [Rotaria sp. Silwood1]CAF3792731.1 unnamed protein product [Rotaria sp. Silwood1]